MHPLRVSRLSIIFLLIICLITIKGESHFNKVLRRSKRDTVRDPRKRWPGAQVPYAFSPYTGRQTKSVFQAAVKEIQDVSCVKFIPRTSEKDYVRVITGDGCYSLIGREGGQQQLSLGEGCFTKGIALHEVMHLLGFFHEQSRLDRDSHVTVHYNNAQFDAKRQFRKYKMGDANTLGEAYDPDSVMHYSNTAFSANGRNTLTYKKDPTRKLGQRQGLSVIDIRQLNKLYNCPKKYLNTTERDNSTTITKPTISVDNCQDHPRAFYTGHCFLNHVMNICSMNTWRMRYLCPRTCGFCTPTCVDTSEYCGFFRYYGYCTTSEKIRQRCRKTCGLCRLSYR